MRRERPGRESVAEGVRGRVAGAAAIVGEARLSVGLECTLVNGSQRHHSVTKTGLKCRRDLFDLILRKRRRCGTDARAGSLAPITICGVAFLPGMDPDRLAFSSYVEPGNPSAWRIHVLPSAREIGEFHLYPRLQRGDHPLRLYGGDRLRYLL